MNKNVENERNNFLTIEKITEKMGRSQTMNVRNEKSRTRPSRLYIEI